MWRGLFCLILSCAVWFSANGETAGAAVKGKIQGAGFVNLRSGPDKSHAPKAVLEEGEEVNIEAEETEWYLISVEDGRKGYVHKDFVQPVRTESSVLVQEPEMVPEPAFEVAAAVVPDTVPTQLQEKKPTRQSTPLIKMIEGREKEVALWILIGVCIFIAGWICGGNYYLRRDRINRTKIRF